MEVMTLKPWPSGSGLLPGRSTRTARQPASRAAIASCGARAHQAPAWAGRWGRLRNKHRAPAGIDHRTPAHPALHLPHTLPSHHSQTPHNPGNAPRRHPHHKHSTQPRCVGRSHHSMHIASHHVITAHPPGCCPWQRGSPPVRRRPAPAQSPCMSAPPPWGRWWCRRSRTGTAAGRPPAGQGRSGVGWWEVGRGGVGDRMRASQVGGSQAGTDGR